MSELVRFSLSCVCNSSSSYHPCPQASSWSAQPIFYTSQRELTRSDQITYVLKSSAVAVLVLQGSDSRLTWPMPSSISPPQVWCWREEWTHTLQCLKDATPNSLSYSCSYIEHKPWFCLQWYWCPPSLPTWCTYLGGNTKSIFTLGLGYCYGDLAILYDDTYTMPHRPQQRFLAARWLDLRKSIHYKQSNQLL